MARQALYELIYTRLKEELLEGRYQALARYPSRRSSALRFGVSLNTIDKAYLQLIDEGFLEAKERSGTFVTDHGMALCPPLEVLEERIEAKQEPPHSFGFRSVDPKAFPYATFKKLSAKLWEEACPDLLESAPFRGDLSLRVALAQHLRQSRALRVDPEDMVVRPNAESLFTLLTALLPEDCAYAFENPGYHPFLKRLGPKQPLHLIPVSDKGLDLERVLACKPELLVCSPSHQFPTGTVLPIKARRRLLDYAHAKEGRYILEDDYDSVFRYQGLKIPALQSQDPGDRVIHLGNVSKSICPGFRISYLCLPKLLSERLKALESGGCPVNTFAQRLLARFISTGAYDRHLSRMRTLYRKKRSLLLSALAAAPLDLKVLGSEAGLHINIGLPAPCPEDRLRAALASVPMPLAFVSDFLQGAAPTKQDKAQILLLGFAALDLESIPKAVDTLLEHLISVLPSPTA